MAQAILFFFLLLSGCSSEEGGRNTDCQKGLREQEEAASTAFWGGKEGEIAEPDYWERWTEVFWEKPAEVEEAMVLGDGIGTGPYMENPYSAGMPVDGLMLAYGGGDARMGMRILTKDAQGVLEYSYYTDGEGCYISCRGIKERGKDLPRYVVHPESISCKSMWPGEHGFEAWKEAEEDYRGGGWTEYCVLDGRLYLVDHEKKTMAEAVSDREKYVVQWILGEARRVACRLEEGKEKPASLAGYLDGSYACQDFNQDGATDYVAAVRREDGQQLLLFLSQADGSYKHKALTQGDNFFCKELGISREGLLYCENSYYRKERRDYFRYDSQAEEFYFVETWQWGYGSLWKDSSTALGEYAIGDYYKEAYWPTTGWYLAGNYKVGEDPYVSVRNDIGYMGSPGWEWDGVAQNYISQAEESLAEELLDDMQGKGAFAVLYSRLKYADERICSAIVYTGGFLIPIHVDRRSGMTIEPTELLPKEGLFRICREGLKDLYGNPVEQEQKEAFLEMVEAGYGNINSPAYSIHSQKGQPRVACYLTAWGMNIVCIREPEEGKEERQENEVLIYMVEKEYFMDTPLWGYMEPSEPFKSMGVS